MQGEAGSSRANPRKSESDREPKPVFERSKQNASEIIKDLCGDPEVAMSV